MKKEVRRDARGRQLQKGESQRSDGRYQYQYQGRDRKRHVVYSLKLLPSDKGEKGEKSLRELEKEIQKKLFQEERIREGNITLNEMFDNYLTRKHRKGMPLARTTVQNYELMYSRHVKESAIGSMKIIDIAKKDIVSFYKNLQEEKLSYGSVLFFNKVLSGVFNMALDDDYIDKNPTIRAMNEIQGKQKVREALTRGQQNELLDYARKHNANMYYMLVFMLDTMCRVSELAGITWDNIDMDDKAVLIDHQLQYLRYDNEEHATYHVNETKGREKRRIPMTDRLYAVLKEVKKYYYITGKDIEVDGVSGFVFFSGCGQLVNAASVRRDLIQLVDSYNKTAKNPIAYITTHMLRHTGATRNAEDGMDMKVLQYLLGHKSIKTVLEIYNHVNQERVEAEMLKAARSQISQG